MKIKLILSILLMLMLGFNTTFAQDDDLESLDFETEELDDGMPSYFGVGAGITYSFTFMNLDELNASIMDPNGLSLPEFKTPLQVFGYEGFVAIPWVKNLRFGYGAYSGNVKEEFEPEGKLYTSVSELDYMSYGARFDYGLVVMNSLAILPGVAIAHSDLSYSLSQYPESFDWANLGNYSADNSKQEFNKSFVLITPSISFEYALEGFLMVRVNAGYNIELFETDWKLNNGAVVENFPELNMNSLNVQIGLFVGLFNY